LGVLLQRIISLESRYGDQFDPKAAWGQLRPATMERKLLSKSSLLSWPGRPSASGGILLMPAAGHKHSVLELEPLREQGDPAASLEFVNHRPPELSEPLPSQLLW
jgi:hypothetical protein